MGAVTDLGNAAVLAGLIALVGLGWWMRTHSWRPLWLLASAELGAWALADTVKELTGRPRPPATQAIGHWTGYGFPCGSTTKATAVDGMLAALLAAASSSWAHKVALWTAALLLAGLVGLSRLYLGANWLTDVLGGLALGGAWLFAVLTTTRTVERLRRLRRPEPRTPQETRS
jgi:membrane-associated phospholipid phosphatase